jgi:hypothetical protein
MYNYYIEAFCSNKKCNTKNYVSLGDLSDLSEQDVDSFYCYKCRTCTVLMCDDDEELTDEFEPENTVEGIKELK